MSRWAGRGNIRTRRESLLPGGLASQCGPRTQTTDNVWTLTGSSMPRASACRVNCSAPTTSKTSANRVAVVSFILNRSDLRDQSEAERRSSELSVLVFGQCWTAVGAKAARFHHFAGLQVAAEGNVLVPWRPFALLIFA